MGINIYWKSLIVFGIAIVFIILKMKKDKEEGMFPLKIIGYYLLGGFQLIINLIHIPVGYAIYIVFFRNPLENRRAKRYAAGLGLIAFIASLFIPAVSDAYYERTRIIEVKKSNFYEFKFENHMFNLKETLDINEHTFRQLRLNDIKVDFEKDGRIKSFKYVIIWKQENGLKYARVSYEPRKESFEVKARKIEQWLQYGKMANVKRIFEMLDSIDLNKLVKDDENYAYYGFQYTWTSANLGRQDENVFIIEDEKIVPFDMEDSVCCKWFNVYGMVQTSENSYSSEDIYYYLFDVMTK